MLSRRDAPAGARGRSAAESPPRSRRPPRVPEARGRGRGRTLPPSPPPPPPPATRRPPVSRPPVALATVAPRPPEGAPVSPLIPSSALHCPAIFAWVRRRRDNKKWRSEARRRLRQVCGGGRSGEALRHHGCPGPEGPGDLGMALLLRRRPWAFARWGYVLGVRGQGRCVPL